MTEEKPPSPWKLTPGRIVLLIMGLLLVLYTAAALLGSLTNYQLVREGAREQTSAPGAQVPGEPAQP